MIDFRTFPEIVAAAKESNRLEEIAYAAEGHGGKKLEKANKTWQEYQFTVYSKIVFNTLQPLNPNMIDIWDNGKICSFAEIYGSNWIDSGKKRLNLLYQLVEDGLSAYELEEKTISVNGKEKDTVLLLNPETKRRDIVMPRKP